MSSLHAGLRFWACMAATRTLRVLPAVMLLSPMTNKGCRQEHAFAGALFFAGGGISGVVARAHHLLVPRLDSTQLGHVRSDVFVDGERQRHLEDVLVELDDVNVVLVNIADATECRLAVGPGSAALPNVVEDLRQSFGVVGSGHKGEGASTDF